MNLKDLKNQTTDFAVIKDFGDNEDFFRLATPGGEVHLPKLDFQKDQPLPDTLRCRIKGYNGTKPIVVHDTARYVSDFYADGFQRGLDFEFQVQYQPDKEHSYYRLIDKNGLIFKLHDTSSVLATGQKVICRFDRLDAYGFSVRRSDTDTNLPMLRIKDLMKGAQLYNKIQARDLEALLHETPELQSAAADYDQGRAIWILAAIRAIDSNIAHWFVTYVLTVPPERVDTMLRVYKSVCLYLLQGSSFLRNLGTSERHGLQELLSTQIERLETFTKALITITKGDSEKFIRRLLENLKESGFLFHPKIQLSVMMILFRVMPSLVNSSLRNIFDTLMDWNPQTWKEEPFRTAFVEQLEIFISDAISDIDAFEQPSTPAQTKTIENVLTAIAIQRQLANFTDKNVDLRMNMSAFYRFLSVLRPAKADTLLYKSFLTMMGVALPVDFTWSDIKETSMMMTRAAVDAPASAKVSPDATRYFATGPVMVEVGGDGITISRSDEGGVQNALPNGMIDWPETQIKINAGYSLTPAKLKQLDKHREFWNAIEEKLFFRETTAKSITTVKHTPDIDDKVTIKVERVTPTANGYLMSCVIDDPTYEGRGLLPSKEVVSYKMRDISIGTFRDSTGQPLKLPAVVVDIDNNDNLIFSLLPFVEEKVREMASIGDSALCVIASENKQYSYSALSERGYGLFIDRDEDMPRLRNGSVIRYTITGYNPYSNAVQGVYEEGPLDGLFVENNRAVHCMMMAIAEDDPDAPVQEVQIDDDEAMTVQELGQIIELLRYKALTVRSNLLKMYDYLSLARLLALIKGDTFAAEELYAQLRVVELYQSFDKNRQIFHTDIEHVLTLAPESRIIDALCRRLQIVASLGNPSDNATLWEIVHDPDDAESYKELAQMVLSYNFLDELNHDDESAARIKDNIAKMLNVVTEQRDLKYYGSESQYVEFKSSLVYPAAKGKSGISAADPDRQEFEILHIIAGFMNTRGGTLYIGVGDDHYERGLAEDFTYYEKASGISSHRRNIRSTDNLANYLQQLIDRSFTIQDIPGNKIAGEYAKTGVDDESTKGVVMVKVDACPHVVYLNGQIFARHGAKTEPYTDPEEIQAFITDRESYYHNFIKSASRSATSAAPASAPAAKVPDSGSKSKKTIPDADEAPAQAGLSAEPTTVAESQSFAPAHNFTIGTSMTRHNVIHEYEDMDHFVTPEFYIRFVGDNQYVLTTDEWSIDDSDSLVLAITADDIDHYLLLLFDDLSATKVPVREIMQKEPGATHSYYGDRRLIFAAPASDADALYGILTNAKASVFERMTPVSEIEQGTMTSTPTRLLESEVAQSGGWTVIPAAMRGLFSQALSTSMKRNQIGVLVKGLSGELTIDAAKALLIKKLK